MTEMCTVFWNLILNLKRLEMHESDMNQKLLVIGNIVPDIEKITLFKKV
jgi:hypothetical protein